MGGHDFPGGHKSSFAHPVFHHSYAERCRLEDETVEGSIEVTLKARSALLFWDAISHGATWRINPGDGRAVIHRYGPGWGNARFGDSCSGAFLNRVTPAQRAILQPLALR